MANRRMGYDNLEEGPRNVIVEHHRRIALQVSLRTRLRDYMNPFDMSVTEFIKLYRMPQYALLDLVEILRPYVPEKRSRIAIPLEIKVLSSIGFFANGSYQRPIGRSSDVNMSQASACNAIEEVVSALNHPQILQRFIKFPTTAAQREVVINRNYVLGMPGVLGFIDGTLVKIVPPRKDQEQHVYRSRKGYTALNVQIVCDATLYISNVNARFPGSVADPYIYRHSHLPVVMRRAFEETPCWLLGDSIYPHLPWLMTPLPHAEENTPEYRYTRLHCHCRNAVERCIGVLKARWRCLLSDRTLHYAPDKAGRIVNSCVVLHNYLNVLGAPNPPPIHENEGEDIQNNLNIEGELLQTADIVRQFLIDFASG